MSGSVIWLPLQHYEGYYEISSTGEVRGVRRRVRISPTNLKPFYKSYPSKTIKPYLTSQGYMLVGLCKDGVRKAISVHRLVGSSFLPNPLNKKEINHKDGDKLNNSVDNLEWVTSSENQLHAFSAGLQRPRRGADNAMSVLEEIDVLFLHYWRSVGYYAKELSEHFDSSKNNIQDILGFRRWSYLKGVVNEWSC